VPYWRRSVNDFEERSSVILLFLGGIRQGN
jgi:hypothetical protein